MSRALKKHTHRIRHDIPLYVMLIPGALFFILFKYLPMAGLAMAFQDYQPFLGFKGSSWVGLTHFIRLFSEPDFLMLLRNTITLALYNLILFFPMPIIVAILLNEIMNAQYKKMVQSIIYLPHFLSWVVLAGITITTLSPSTGIINQLLSALGLPAQNILFDSKSFRILVTVQVIWKEMGWGTILFLAALTNIDVELYDAAAIDGANRWQRMVNIIIPAILPTVITLLILRLGNFLDSGFEQIYLMQNSMNRNVSEVFDTYVYSNGIVGGQMSYSAAVGFFKSFVSLGLVLCANFLAKKTGNEGVY
jgi:putative aldouronate transport system permease protein